MAEIDPRDAILQAHTPAVMVPRHGTLPMMEKSGHRFLIASDGVWLEVLRPWLHARVNIGTVEVPLPFGAVEHLIQYAFKPANIAGITQRFLADAARAFPNECAAWAVYDENTGLLEYRPLIAAASGPAGLEGIHRPRLADHEHLAIDIHSHGAHGAGFSPTDDEDDAGEVKYATVFGNIDGEITSRTRLCLLGTLVYFDDEDLPA